jgi:hypothetical protein
LERVPSRSSESPWWLSPPAETLEKPAVIEETGPEAPGTQFSGGRDPGEFDENEFFWSQLTDRDLDDLAAGRNYPDPCSWCGGRWQHNPRCDELRELWEVAMPFGKYKGKPLSQVPADYLAWLVANTDALDSALLAIIESRLEAPR